MLEAEVPLKAMVCVFLESSVASALVSRDADDDAQNMTGPSSLYLGVYKSSGPSKAGVTSPDVDGGARETMT